MPGSVKPVTVKLAESVASSLAVESVAVTEPEVHVNAMVTSGSGESGWSGTKSLKTLKVAVLVLVMVQTPSLTRGTFRQSDWLAV